MVVVVVMEELVEVKVKKRKMKEKGEGKEFIGFWICEGDANK